MATYPDDASISIESFSVVSETNFTNTGSMQQQLLLLDSRLPHLQEK